MASTRNKNTIGNYQSEQWSINKQADYSAYERYATPNQSYHPGDGLLGARTSINELSYNPRDIESYLFGIGSTNLVNPQPEVTPQFKNIKSLNMIDRIPLLIPKKLVTEPNQRYMYLN